MRLATVYLNAGTVAARIDGAQAILLEEYGDVGELLARGGLASAASAKGPAVELSEIRFAPVVTRPSKIVCVGLNYRAHILEMKRDLPEHPVLFAKFADSLLAADDPIPLPPESDAADWEGELGVIIGSTVRRADAQTAGAAIAGYTIANDVSFRDWQFRTREWLQGKAWDASLPLGPVMATPDEIPDEAYLTTHVNDVEKQRGDIHDLVHSPGALVQYISTITTLRPGDVIVTGTPGGVGHARTPREYLAHGDIVSITIDGIGTLRNKVVEEAS
ncbi:fumarylacetoacetate hydrolase family protein [Microbacterium sp. MAHUQ-60]|uniref:fumarylacetoacetate hydrolase family protein n=1 Tax=unclassified Microbacterium TaxID=2609290 RepID=UPI00361E76C9